MGKPVDWDKFEETGSEMTDASWPEKGQELKIGDAVQGRYVAKKTNIGKNKSNVYVVEQEDGSKIGVWGSTVIDSRFENIAVGKMVAIEYIGEKEGKNGTYHNYKVGQGILTPGDEVQV